MRVAVQGATGRVGRHLLDRIAAAPDLALAEGPDAAEVVIDFSAPAGTMALLDRLAGTPLPLVVGTTGFDPAQAQRLRAEGARRPLLVAANFTPGFQAFRAAARALAGALPNAGLVLAETYNAAKKPVASGTTQGLLADLAPMAAEREIALDIRREGEVAGINTLRLTLDGAEIALSLTVASRDAYAAGALEAARWLIGRKPGFYTASDID